MSLIQRLLRKNILNLTPYSSARDEYAGEDAVFLDANENPFRSEVNRYPDPLQLKLKVKLSQIKHVHYENIFVGNGSDEAIDLIIRAFCEPGTDNVISIKPTYGMYKVCADINNVEFREVLLTPKFQIDKKGIFDATDKNSKLLFLCSPNNPSSNSLYREDIIYLLENFRGLVVLDEAYIDFAEAESFLNVLGDYPNLVVLQTLSKAWGMAGLRLGMLFAQRELVGVMNKIKYPYNVNVLTQQFVLDRLRNVREKELWVNTILEQRESLKIRLSRFDCVSKILPSDANFLMVRFKEAKKVFNYLMDKKIIIRDRSKVALCEDYLRITIGTREENNALLSALEEY